MKLYQIFKENEEHWDALEQTGFWGKQGAGCLFYSTKTERYLIAYRSQYVQEPNTWGTWGGALDSNESPKIGLTREIKEETGYTGQLTLKFLWTFEHESGFKYHNFLAIIPDEFQPRLDWENQGFEWVNYGEWPTPLHPGMQMLLDSGNL